MQTTRASVLVLTFLLAGTDASSAAEADSSAAAAGSEATELPLVLAVPAAAASTQWSASGGAEDGGYRISLSRGAVDVGLRFESKLASLRPTDARVDNAALPGAILPALSLGLRTVAAGPATASSLAERALGSSPAVPSVSKVGIEWKPAQRTVFFHQGLGFRLDGDDRVVMRLRKGSLGVYMYRTF